MGRGRAAGVKARLHREGPRWSRARAGVQRLPRHTGQPQVEGVSQPRLSHTAYRIADRLLAPRSPLPATGREGDLRALRAGHTRFLLAVPARLLWPSRVCQPIAARARRRTARRATRRGSRLIPRVRCAPLPTTCHLLPSLPPTGLLRTADHRLIFPRFFVPTELTAIGSDVVVGSGAPTSQAQLAGSWTPWTSNATHAHTHDHSHAHGHPHAH